MASLNSNKSVADRDQRMCLCGVHELGTMKSLESSGTRSSKANESEKEVVDHRRIQAAGDRDAWTLWKTSRAVNNLHTKPTSKKTTIIANIELENPLSSHFFEVKNQYLSSCSNAEFLGKKASWVQETESSRAAELGIETRLEEKSERESWNKFGVQNNTEEGAEGELITLARSYIADASSDGDDGMRKCSAFTQSNAVFIDLEPQAASNGFKPDDDDCESDSEAFEFKEAIDVSLQQNILQSYMGKAAADADRNSQLHYHHQQQQEQIMQQQYRDRDRSMQEEDQEEEEEGRLDKLIQELSVQVYSITGRADSDDDHAMITIDCNVVHQAHHQQCNLGPVDIDACGGRAKRMMDLQPMQALTPQEIAEIWGVCQHTQASLLGQH